MTLIIAIYTKNKLNQLDKSKFNICEQKKEGKRENNTENYIIHRSERKKIQRNK